MSDATLPDRFVWGPAFLSSSLSTTTHCFMHMSICLSAVILSVSRTSFHKGPLLFLAVQTHPVSQDSFHMTLSIQILPDIVHPTVIWSLKFCLKLFYRCHVRTSSILCLVY